MAIMDCSDMFSETKQPTLVAQSCSVVVSGGLVTSLSLDSLHWAATTSYSSVIGDENVSQDGNISGSISNFHDSYSRG